MAEIALQAGGEFSLPRIESAPRHGFIRFLFIALLAGVFYTMLEGFDLDVLAILLFIGTIIASFIDVQNLWFGWFLMAPYFHHVGADKGSNIAQNLTHVFFIPLMVVVFLARRSLWRSIVWKRDIWYLLFIAYMLVSAGIASVDKYSDIRQIVIVNFLPFLLYLVVQSMDLDERFFRRLMSLSAFHLCVLVLVTWFEVASGKSLFMDRLTWQDLGNFGEGRAAGPFQSPIILGLFINFLFVIATIGYWKKYITTGYFLAILVGASMIVFLTFTRSVWLGFFGSGLFLIFRAETKRSIKVGILFGIGVGLLVALIILLNTPDLSDRLLADTGLVRLVIAASSIVMFLNNPFVGVGYGTFDYLVSTYLENIASIPITAFTTSHVTILTFLAELGLVGVLPLGIFIWMTFWGNTLTMKQVPLFGDRRTVLCAFAFLLAFVINAFLIDMRFFSMSYCMAFISIALYVRIVNPRAGQTP